MAITALQAISDAGGAIAALRESQATPIVFPVTPEFTNWRSEQRAWRESVALLDQSHHMTDLFISGPGALQLLSDTGINRFSNFDVNQAKQFVAVNEDGFVIGDAVLVRLEEESFNLVGWHPVLDWVQFNGENGPYDVSFQRDASSAVREAGVDPVLYRYEIQGPNALLLLERVIEGEVPLTKFFGMATLEIAGVTVRSIRHGMAGQPGFELFGPWAERIAVRDAIVREGEGVGLVLVGAKAYSAANLESAWVPSPFPAIFTGSRAEEYLAWLPAERLGSLAGSYDSWSIDDFYLTPGDLGYARLIDFDHEFIGRDALRARPAEMDRVKVTLVWNPEDVAAVQRSLLEPGIPAKYIEFPKARFGMHQMDRVLVGDKTAGISFDLGYLANEHAFVSLATVENSYAAPGTEVVVMWGESPASSKPAVEEHRQVSIRATVAPAPYSSFARDSYRRNA